MNLNITMLRDTIKCPRMAHNLHVLQRGPLRVPVALEEGQLFHEGMHLRLSGRDAILPSDLPSWAFVGQEARDNFLKHRLWIPISNFTVPSDWEIIGAEHALTRPISPNLNLQGRLDGLIRLNGRRWGVQWKTYTDDLNSLVEQVRLSWHEVGYQWLTQADDYAGTILGACQKLPSYRMLEGEDGKKRRTEITDDMRSQAFTVHYITRSPSDQQRMARNLIQTALQVQQDLAVTPPRQNYDACFGPFRRGKCSFFQVCHYGADINGPEFTDLEDRYADTQEG